MPKKYVFSSRSALHFGPLRVVVELVAATRKREKIAIDDGAKAFQTEVSNLIQPVVAPQRNDSVVGKRTGVQRIQQLLNMLRRWVEGLGFLKKKKGWLFSSRIFSLSLLQSLSN